MNPFPAERSVIVLDNCCIHHNEDLEAEVWQAGMYSIVCSLDHLLTYLQVVSSCLSLRIRQIST